MPLVHNLERPADSWRTGGPIAGNEKPLASKRMTVLPVPLLVVAIMWLVADIAAPSAWFATPVARSDGSRRAVRASGERFAGRPLQRYVERGSAAHAG